MTLMIDGDAKPNDIAKVLSTQPQYYGYDDFLMITFILRDGWPYQNG